MADFESCMYTSVGFCPCGEINNERGPLRGGEKGLKIAQFRDKREGGRMTYTDTYERKEPLGGPILEGESRLVHHPVTTAHTQLPRPLLLLLYQQFLSEKKHGISLHTKGPAIWCERSLDKNRTTCKR